MPAQTRSSKKAAARRLNPFARKYLVLYNTVEALLWAFVVVHFFLIARVSGLRTAHDSVATMLFWVQTSALLEIVHSLLRIVSSPVSTTVMQVSSRLLLVWGIDRQFPELTSRSPAFASMLAAWSVTEVLRYSYYAIHLQGQVPDVLLWLRYSLFYVLYPVGVASETWLVFISLDKANTLNPLYWYFLVAAMLTYLPGFYILFTYMISQRRKVLKRQGKQAMR
ncbi:hypothetical protein PYCC9005_001067 [Savitreella phatthalungensis]